MLSEVILEVTLVVGNAHPRQKGPGHSVVSITPERTRAQYREILALEVETTIDTPARGQGIERPETKNSSIPLPARPL